MSLKELAVHLPVVSHFVPRETEVVHFDHPEAFRRIHAIVAIQQNHPGMPLAVDPEEFIQEQVGHVLDSPRGKKDIEFWQEVASKEEEPRKVREVAQELVLKMSHP